MKLQAWLAASINLFIIKKLKEAATRGVLELIFKIWQENTCDRVSFLIKLQVRVAASMNL